MKRFTLLLLFSLLLAACGTSTTEPTVAPPPAEPETATSNELVVTNVLANMTLPSDTGSFWMTITNNSDTDDALIGAEVAGCGVIELHDMFMENDVMVMRQVEGGQIPIPAGETVELKRGGLHVMCLQKEAPLEEGTTLDITLEFANAGLIEVTSNVVTPDSANMNMDMEHGDMMQEETDE